MSAAGDMPAFPADTVLFTDRLGLTKRELFAAMAMAGDVAYGGAPLKGGEPRCAERWVAQADALIAELSKNA